MEIPRANLPGEDTPYGWGRFVAIPIPRCYSTRGRMPKSAQHIFSTRSRDRLCRWAAPVLLAAVVASAPVVAEVDGPSIKPAEIGESSVFSIGALKYRPGRGLRAGDTGLVLGGFINIKAESADETGEEYALDDLNLFLIFDRFDRLRVVVDAQMKDIFTSDEHGSGTSDFAFNLRRLFGDFAYNDRLHLRAGTFLTPIGYWNLILAPPLTSTVEVPLIVKETFFEETTTGLMLHGSIGAGDGRFGYSLFSQFLEPLESDPDLNPPDGTIGFRWTYDRGPGWSVGASYQSADVDGQWSHLGGIHTLVQLNRVEVLSEAYYQDGDGRNSEQWGAFLQGTLEVTHTTFLVGRYEHFEAPKSDPAVDALTIGGVWRPFPFLALKLEYRFAEGRFEDEDLDGLFTSFSSFF